MKNLKKSSFKSNSGSILRIYCLGMFRILRPGENETIGSLSKHKMWLVFKYLLIHRGTTVPTLKLINDIWPEHKNPDDTTTLRITVSRLRAALNPESGAKSQYSYIIYQKNSCAFNLKVPYWLDIEVFEQLCATAKKQGAHNRTLAINAYKEALDLYQGDFLAEDPHIESAKPVREYYRLMFLEAVRELVGWLLELKDFDWARYYLEKAVAIDPYIEDLQMQLIRVLLDSDALQAAKACYGSYTTLLYNKLQIKPSEALKKLYNKIIEKEKHTDVTDCKENETEKGNPAFGERLLGILKEKKLTQNQLAQKLGVNAGTVSRYISDKRPPSYDKICKMANCLDTSVNYLLGTVPVNKCQSLELPSKETHHSPDQQLKFNSEGLTAPGQMAAPEHMVKKHPEQAETLIENQLTAGQSKLVPITFLKYMPSETDWTNEDILLAGYIGLSTAALNDDETLQEQFYTFVGRNDARTKPDYESVVKKRGSLTPVGNIVYNKETLDIWEVIPDKIAAGDLALFSDYLANLTDLADEERKIIQLLLLGLAKQQLEVLRKKSYFWVINVLNRIEKEWEKVRDTKWSKKWNFQKIDRIAFSFGQCLIDLLKQKNISQARLIQELAINESTILQYIKGNKAPTYDNICKIADYFDVSVKYLLKQATKDDADLLELAHVSKVPLEIIAPLMDHNTVSFSHQRLQDLLRQKDLSQSQLRQKLGLERLLFAKYINGTTVPPYEIVTKIADYFDVSPEYFLEQTIIERKTPSKLKKDEATANNEELPESLVDKKQNDFNLTNLPDQEIALEIEEPSDKALNAAKIIEADTDASNQQLSKASPPSGLPPENITQNQLSRTFDKEKFIFSKYLVTIIADYLGVSLDYFMAQEITTQKVNGANNIEKYQHLSEDLLQGLLKNWDINQKQLRQILTIDRSIFSKYLVAKITDYLSVSLDHFLTQIVTTEAIPVYSPDQPVSETLPNQGITTPKNNENRPEPMPNETQESLKATKRQERTKREKAQIFGERLEELLKEKKLSHSQLAWELGISKGMISQYIHGYCVPSYEIIYKMISYFHVSIDYFLGYDTPKNDDPMEPNCFTER
jgi:transcriptional regulator with XRE-family HTH domain/DNA-binding SARP family transcriptional activator